MSEWTVEHPSITPREVASYPEMRVLVREIGADRWNKAGQPLDPAWPAATADELSWRKLDDDGTQRAIDLPDGTVITVTDPPALATRTPAMLERELRHCREALSHMAEVAGELAEGIDHALGDCPDGCARCEAEVEARPT